MKAIGYTLSGEQVKGRRILLVLLKVPQKESAFNIIKKVLNKPRS
jgi:hypothetical protein